MKVAVDGLDEAIAYFSGLAAGIEKAAKSIGEGSYLRKLEQICNEETQSTVYAKFVGDPSTPPQIKEGALAQIGEDGSLEVGMSMDPALLSIAGAAPGEMTYAAYMLPEFYSASFLKGEAFAKLPIPFTDAWQEALADRVPEDVSAAIDREINR